MEALGIGVIEWSELASAFAAGMFLFEWAWGGLCDRTERMLLVVASLLCMSALFALYTFHVPFSIFLVLQLLSGMFSVSIGPITRSYVSEESPLRSVGFYSSLWWASSSTGRVIGPLVGAFIAQAWSFEYSFYASSALCLFLILFVIVVFPHNPPRERSKSTLFGGLKIAMNRRSAVLLFVSATSAFVTYSIVRTFLPLYASVQMNMSTVGVGTMIAGVFAAQLGGMPLIGWLSDKFGRRRTAAAGFTLSSFSFLMYFLARTPNQIVIVSVAVGLGLSVTSLLLGMIPDVTPGVRFGAVIGVYGSFEDLGVVIGPLMYGLVWSATSPIYIFAVSAVAQVLSAILILAIQQQNWLSRHISSIASLLHG